MVHISQEPSTAMHRNVHRHGFTILEVMMALALLATAMTAMMSNWAGLNEGRRRIIERQQAQALVAEIVERISTLDWSNLGSAGAPWSQCRFFDLATGGANRPPLSDNAASAEDDLVLQGLAVATTGLRDLRIYIEYYRALDDGALPGMLQTADSNADAFRARFANLAKRNDMRILSGNPTSSIVTDAPIFVRVLASWANPEDLLTDDDGDGIPDGLEDDDPRLGSDQPSDSLPSRPFLELFTTRRN